MSLISLVSMVFSRAQDVRFQFMNTVSVFEKPINLTYTHARGDNLTTLDGSLVVDPANKVSVNYEFGSGNCRVKYAYAHGELRRTVFEPCYDISKNAWDFAVSNQCKGGDSIKATYHTTTKLLGLEWNRDSSINGSFKVFLLLCFKIKNQIFMSVCMYITIAF